MTTALGRRISLELSAPALTVDAENPWPGLESFRESDVTFFRGRDREAQDLLAYVQRERLTVLYGLSGLGKSSLLQAGLFPSARHEGFFPVYIRLTHDDGASPPREQILNRIAEEAAVHDVDAPAADVGRTLWEHFHREDHAYWTSDNTQLTPLLVFDQFEEAFTLGSSSPERKRRSDDFLQELGDLIEGRPPASVRAQLGAGEVDRNAFAFNRHAYKILIGIRQDFLAELETLRARVPSVMVNRMPLSPLRGDAALLVTAAGGDRLIPPAEHPSAPGVGEEIVRRLAGDSDDDRVLPLSELVVDPALLSLFCRELNERRKSLKRHSITSDLLAGSREQILAEYYQRSIADLGLPVRKLVEDQLLTVSGHRNSEALENAEAQPGVTPAAIEKLIARRILRREERDRRTRIELTHDVLTGVVRQSRDQRRAEEQAEAQTHEERLRAEQLTREAARARRVTLALSAAGVVFLALAVYGWIESRTAKQARAKAEQALVMEAKADSAREHDHAVQALAINKRDSMVALKNEELGKTLSAMTRAQDSVRLQQKKAIVASEIADRYLRMSAQAITRRIATDSALSQTVMKDIAKADSIRRDARAQVDGAREDANKLIAENKRRAAVVDSVICASRAVSTPSDTAALRRLRDAIQQRLVDAKISTGPLCAAGPDRRGGS